MKFLLNRRIGICMLFVALTMLGYVSYKQLPIELLPNAELPQLVVSVSYVQDMDPAFVESEVIIPIEGAIGSIGGVDRMVSTVGARNSSITVEFKNNVNIKVTTLKLEEKMKEVSATLPEGFTARVQRNAAASMSRTNFFMQLQVRGMGGVDRVRKIVDEKITTELENIDGVAAVSVFGGREKAIEVRVDLEACKALNLTTSSISRLLSNQSQDKVFVGNVKEPDNQFFVHIKSTYNRISDIENLIVAPGPILLKDVATVFFDLKEETSYSRVNGRDAVTVSLVADGQANLIDLSKRTVNVVRSLNERLQGYEVEIVKESSTADEMENNINSLIELALIGGILAVFVLWFFLKNLRLVFFIALAIPISIFSAFNFFYWAGISINFMTLLGITLAVGMLLDNSIVVLENIYRLSVSGLPPEQAAKQGTTEVWRSVVAATLTTVVIFIPFIFTENQAIKLIGDHIGISIISTLLVSLAVALLFVPMVTYWILMRKNSRTVFYEKVSLAQRPVQIYLVVLKWCLRNPGATIFGSVILLFVTLGYSLSTSVQQRREVDADRFNINVTMRTGSTLESTDNLVRSLEELLTVDEIPELQDVIVRVNQEDARLTLVLQKDFKKTSRRGITEIQEDIRTKLPRVDGAQINMSNALGGGQSGSDVMRGLTSLLSIMGIGQSQESILIKGSDYDIMQIVGEDIRYFLEQQEYISRSNVSNPSRQPEVRLNFDQILLTSYEISRSNITTGLNELSRELATNTQFKLGDETYEIVIREKTTEEEDEEQRTRQVSFDQLNAVQIESASGGLHTLKDIASVNRAYGRSQISRVNQDKQLRVTYAFTREIANTKSLLDGYRTEIDEYIAIYNLPVGVAIEVIHEEDTLADFKFLLLAAIILIFIILACVFESITTPFVMLFSIPLAAIGSMLALLMTGNSLTNPITIMGLLILLAVVVKNGIILIDYSNILRKRGFRRERALMTAGLSRTRPILITAASTIIAMFPLAMGDSSTYAGAIGGPFAVTVIGGLAFSTLLTLVIIPTVSLSLENALLWYRGLERKTQLFHLALILIGVLCIYLYVDEMLWQVIYMISLIILVPGATYFMQTSLRRAKADVISENKEINIVVRNLVKIYDREGRFMRQWNSGLALQKTLGVSIEYHSLKDFLYLSWQFVLLGFGIYFTFFFIESKTWIFFLSIAIYSATLFLWRKIRAYLFYRFPNSRTVRYINRLVFWSLPPLLIYIYYIKLENPALVAVISALFAVGLIIYLSSQYLYERNINIERISGRFAAFRRAYFRFVKTVPIIGKRRRPFKALKGISFDIKTGMFGLLGPNGAGKSTFMRIITGILEQSYGTIWINGMDTLVYREELQGLIGFLPQEFGTYENMTAGEFLDYQGILKGLKDTKVRKERIEYVLKSVSMFDKIDHKIGSFSGGMKQRIGIALILLHLPRILVVDEPTAGLDPRERIRFRNLLVELSKSRIVIFSTHIIEDISSSCNQVVVINKGEMKYFGDPIEMVGMAEGKIWQFLTEREEFEKLDKSLVVHNIQDGNLIQVRYISLTQPHPDAVLMEANLEDAYLCLLKNM